MDVHPTKNGIYRYWSIPISSQAASSTRENNIKTCAPIAQRSAKLPVNYLQCAALPNTASTSRWKFVLAQKPSILVDVDPTVIGWTTQPQAPSNAKHLWNSMVPNMCKYPKPWDGIGSAPFDTLVNATMVKRRSFSLLLLVEDTPWWRRH